MDVPEIMSKRGGSLSGMPSLLSFEGHAARMDTPGAAISGYGTDQNQGPLDEKYATTGAGL
ncbi:hypothetical protein OROMI_030443 [Orobanche minor]